MKPCWLIVACLFCGDVAADSKKDMTALEGEWSMVSADRDGQPLGLDYVKNAKRVAKAGETTVTVNGMTFLKAKYTVDPSKKPKSIAYELTDGPNKGKTQLGIYELDGETVKFCFAGPGQPRPTDFTSTAGSGRTLSVWRARRSTRKIDSA